MGNTCLEVEECLLEARHLASCVILLYRAQSAGVTWPKVGRGTKVGRASGSRSDMAVKNGVGMRIFGTRDLICKCEISPGRANGFTCTVTWVVIGCG